MFNYIDFAFGQVTYILSNFSIPIPVSPDKVFWFKGLDFLLIVSLFVGVWTLVFKFLGFEFDLLFKNIGGIVYKQTKKDILGDRKKE